MNKISIQGFPRIGQNRELKKLTEAYFKKSISLSDYSQETKELQLGQWKLLQQSGLDFIPSGDYSLYDTYLDTAFLLNAIPREYSSLGLNDIDTYFAMARGYQEGDKDVKALSMRKWFNTNYHYMVAEIEDDVQFRINGNHIFDQFNQAKTQGILTRPGLIGPFTFLKLARFTGKKQDYADYIEKLLPVYSAILQKLNSLGAQYVQLDEPILVTDLDSRDRKNFLKIYQTLLPRKGEAKVILNTYFGDVRDLYQDICGLGFDGIGLDFVEGSRSLDLVKKLGFPQNTLLFAGVVNGKNIWKNDYKISLEILGQLAEHVSKENIIISTSCSLLHVPYTVSGETKLEEKYRKHLSFALEKILELKDLATLWVEKDYTSRPVFLENQKLIREKKESKDFSIPEVRKAVSELNSGDFERKPAFNERIQIQEQTLHLPPLPTTTIGSFPQTGEVRKNRLALKKGEITEVQYEENVKKMIREVIQLQEEIGLDVLVHGEFERNDMVEYFGEQLDGFLFTENGWVQSYGTRAVKPPVIFGDVRRSQPMTVKWITYAQSLTKKPMKGMLTGPVTILNWSFPREDISRKEICYQIALAIREEVLDLERAGIKIIQIDEAALREKLPLRQADWKSQYLDWAIPAFRLVHARVKPETQIHTHMCYSEFGSIIRSIEDMNADVLSCEAARSDMTLLDFLRQEHYHQQVGPGLYDIHSPRIPSVEEFQSTIRKMVSKLPTENLWVNPDCGLKTRGQEETVQSLKHMVAATRKIRTTLAG